MPWPVQTFASLHILRAESVEWVSHRLRHADPGHARASPYPLLGLLDSLAGNAIESGPPGEAVEAALVYLNVFCDLKADELSSTPPAPDWMSYGYQSIYAIPYSRAVPLASRMTTVEIDQDLMQWLLSEIGEAGGRSGAVGLDRALGALRTGIAKIAAGETGILWLRRG